MLGLATSATLLLARGAPFATTVARPRLPTPVAQEESFDAQIPWREIFEEETSDVEIDIAG